MDNIEVINVNKYDGEDYIYIGRPSRFGNPYSSKNSKIAESVPSKKIAIEKFEAYLNEHPEIIDDLIDEMNKKNVHKLGCWCKPKKCHGDIYMKKIIQRKYKSII